MNDIETTPLFRWAAERLPVPIPTPIAAVHDLDAFRQRSPRALLEHRPRETAEQASQALDRCLGLAPRPPVADFEKFAARRRA